MTYTAGSTNSGTFTIPTATIPMAGSTTLTITGIKSGSACSPIGASFAASYVPVTNVTADQVAIAVVATPSGGSVATVNYCSGAGSASVSVTGVTNATDYVWSLPSGLTGTSTASSITVSGSTPGTYTVSVTPRDVASGITCSGSQVTGTVKIVASPSGGSISAVNYCSSTGSASISVTGVSNVTDYVWSLPSGLTGTSTTSSISVTGSTAGAYTVSVTPRDVASGITCSGSQVTGTVTVVASPSGGSIAAVDYCSSTGSASISVTGVSNATDYVWALPSGLTGTSTTSSITVSGSTAGSYTVSVTPRDVASGITCSGSQVTGTVTIVASPSGGSISAVDFCSSTGSASVSVTGVSNATDYVWSLPSGLTGTSTTSSITVSGSTPGSYTVSVTPRDVASGITCSGSQVTGTVTVLAPATAVANASGNATVPYTTPYTLSGSATNYTSYSWSASSGTGTLSNTGTLAPTYTPSAGQTGTVTVTLTVNANSPCASPVTSTMVLTITAPAAANIWIGTTTAWATGSNWSFGTPPSSCSDSALIPSTPTGGSWPVISASVQVGNLEMQNGAQLTINSAQTLSVCGIWKGGATSNASVLGTGIVMLNGTGAQTLINRTSFINLTINKASGLTTASGSVDVKNALVLQQGNFTNTGAVTLKSDASGTGYLDNFTYPTTTGTYTGNLTVERYLSGSVGYRDLSSPVSSTVADWGADFPVVGPNGVYCWYAYNPYPTLQYYKESDNSVTSNFYGGFISYTTNTLPLVAMQGYAAQINTLPMTVNTTGTPNRGSQSINITRTTSSTTSADGWNMIGNPYPSPVRWSAIKNANPTATDGSIYRFYASGQYSGNWATHNGVAGTNGATDLIASSQAFFVSASQNATVKLNDTVRSAGNPPFFKMNSALPDEIRINLSNSVSADEIVAYTDPNATYGYDPGYDATKFTGLNIVHLGFDMPAKELAINVLDSVTEQTELPLRMVVTDTGTYALTATELNLTDLVAYFKDAQTNSLIDLSATAPTLYLNGGQDYSGRYSIVFRHKLATSIGAVDDPNIKIYASGNRVYIERSSSSAAVIDITNELGQRIINTETDQQKTQILLPGHEELWYAFVRVTEGSKVSAKKLLIRNGQ